MQPWKISLKELTSQKFLVLEMLIDTCKLSAYRKWGFRAERWGWFIYHGKLAKGGYPAHEIWCPNRLDIYCSRYRIIEYEELIKLLTNEILDNRD